MRYLAPRQLFRTDTRTATVPPPQNPISPAWLGGEGTEAEEEEKGKKWDRFDWGEQDDVERRTAKHGDEEKFGGREQMERREELLHNWEEYRVSPA